MLISVIDNLDRWAARHWKEPSVPRMQLVQRASGVLRREHEPEGRARNDERGEKPRERGEAREGERRDEQAPDAQSDAHDGVHQAEGGTADRGGEGLHAPQLEERLRAESAAEP